MLVHSTLLVSRSKLYVTFALSIAFQVLDALRSDQPLYQSQYDSIDFSWNATDDTSDIANMTWMAGLLPLMDDGHAETETIDTQVWLICCQHAATTAPLCASKIL